MPWMKVSGLRNRLKHEYSGLNRNIIADAIFNDIPELIKQLEKLKVAEAAKTNDSTNA